LGAQSSDLIQGKWVLEKKGIEKEGKKSLKNDFINKMTFEFKSMVSLSEFSLEPLRWKMVLISKFKTLTLSASSDSLHSKCVNYLKEIDIEIRSWRVLDGI
jgi:hypothetical protein